MGHVEDVGDIANMPIGCNAIFVEDIQDETLPRCQADIYFEIELSLPRSYHQELLITRMTFMSFSSSLIDQESTGITINTYRC